MSFTAKDGAGVSKNFDASGDGSGTPYRPYRVTQDGDDVTQGALADTPSTAVEDATPRTIISLLKGAKNYLRTISGLVLGAGTAIVGKFTTDQTTHGTTDLVAADITKIAGAATPVGHGVAATAMRVELPTDGTGVVGLASAGYVSAPTVTRPANTTPYTDGDVVGGAITFTNAGPSGGHVYITAASLRIDVAAIPAGMTSFRLYLYDATPPSAIADNSAWDLPSGDRANFLGYIDLGSPADLVSTLFTQAVNVDLQVKLAATTSLFGYLVATTGYTPAANSEVYVPKILTVGV